MPVSFKKIFKDLPKSKQKALAKAAKKEVEEYNKLQAIRKELGITQEEIASKQGIKQVNISNLEKRKDMHISTLKKYVEALGCKLEITIKVPGKSKALSFV